EIGAARVGLRISPGSTVNGIEEGGTEEIHPALAERLGGLGLAYLHLVSADPDAPVFAKIRAAWPGTLVANPVLEEMSSDAVHRASGRLLDAGADLIALGRPFLANPDLVRRLRLDAPLNQVRDRYLMYVGGADGYTDYPTLDDQPSRSSIVAFDGPRVV
ncbi:alkene reductase, partial [Streptomyces sp. 13-12-16]